MTTKGTDNRFRSLTVVGEAGTPATPASGDFKLYVADDGTFYVMDDTGTPTALGGGGFSDPMTTRGDIIVRNASNVTARLGIGSAGKVLSSDGTDVSWQTPASAAGLVLLEQHSPSSAASSDFSSWYSSTYDTYVWELLNIVPATANVDFYVRFGNTSADSTNHYSNTSLVWAASSTVVTSAASTTAFKLRNSAIIDSNSNGGVTGTMRLWYPGSTGTFRRAHLSASYLNGDPEAVEARCEYTGSGGSIVDFVSFLFSSGNITSGTIRCYGVVKT